MNRGGRPTLHGMPLTRVTVYLQPHQYLSASEAGSGNVSDGLRKQLDELESLRQWARSQRHRVAGPGPVPRSRHQ